MHVYRVQGSLVYALFLVCVGVSLVFLSFTPSHFAFTLSNARKLCLFFFFLSNACKLYLSPERVRARSLSHTHSLINSRFVSLFLCHTHHTPRVLLFASLFAYTGSRFGPTNFGSHIYYTRTIQIDRTHELWVSCTIL